MLTVCCQVVHNAKEQKGVFTLVIKCFDFRIIRMIFMNQAFDEAAVRDGGLDGKRLQTLSREYLKYLFEK